ncbi:hypothetical protein [Actinomadura sp. 3N407]|uniref:hypothetical protein n=1 Tax=Actinomadura sp. 3N407 TaxID=3457423 RepID=UPI003FCDAA7F
MLEASIAAGPRTTGYADHARRYMNPLLGHLLVAELSVAHVEEVFAVIEREHRQAGRRP